MLPQLRVHACFPAHKAAGKLARHEPASAGDPGDEFRFMIRTAPLLLLALCGTTALAQAPTTTASFARPVTLAEPSDNGHTADHTAVRCQDLNGDGIADLLLGGGDGRLWVHCGRAGKPKTFVAASPLLAGTRAYWGSGYTGAVLADANADDLPDLWVGHSNHRMSIHLATGTLQFREEAIEFDVQNGCHGRFDVIDWDGDGLPDVVTGSFGGLLEWHQNTGSPHAPAFGVGHPFQGISVAYNAHPRLLDFNLDGRLDLLLGVNWGTVTLYRGDGSPAEPRLGKGESLRWADDGSDLNLRAANGDDTTPDLADVDGDGVLDLISGGNNGRVFLMRGIAATDRVNELRRLLKAAGPAGLRHFEQDAEARRSMLGCLGALQADLGAGLMSREARDRLAADLTALADEHEALLGWRNFDTEVLPHAPILTAQFRVVTRAACGDDPDLRRLAATALRLPEGHARLWNELGVVLADNATATPRQLTCMHELLTALPRATWDVELVGVADWLGPAVKSTPIKARTAVNIFAMNLGVPENSFPPDAPRAGVTDVFLICLAHEVAHNMLDTVGRRARPDLFERKFAGLARAAGPEVVYRPAKHQGLDIEATRERLREAGHWDGRSDSWQDAWRSWFAGKEKFEKAHCRGNIQFFLDAPQEAFATLANQYVTDSQLMFELARTRWEAGHRAVIDQFLLIVDYLSEGGMNVPVYRLERGGRLQVGSAHITRNQAGLIASLTTTSTEARFEFDDEGLVTSMVWRSRSSADPTNRD